MLRFSVYKTINDGAEMTLRGEAMLKAWSTAVVDL